MAAFGKLFDLGAERGQVPWVAAGHQALVGHHFPVHSGAARVADVGGQGGKEVSVRPHTTSASTRVQGPWQITPGGLTGLEDVPHEADGGCLAAQLVGADRAAGHDDGVVVIGGDLVCILRPQAWPS